MGAGDPSRGTRGARETARLLGAEGGLHRGDGGHRTTGGHHPTW